jgi:2-polyprenyl-3-methyl-5-hydroxy-6-metoxy-1,4-benzoquinol methylase
MSDPDNPFIAARLAAEGQTVHAQELNRHWWERMPMTYVAWEAAERGLGRTEDFRRLVERILDSSPFLRLWFANRDFSGARVLDLGCGSGVFSCLLARLGGTVTAIDLTEAATRLARQTADASGVSFTVARADAEALAFRDAVFDFVFSWGVLHHTRDMEAAIGEMARVLKPGGRGLMMVYHRLSVAYYGHGLYWLLVKGKILSGHTFATATDFYTDGYYHRYLTRAELAGLLARSGLRVERLHVTQYANKILPFLPARADDWLKARFGMCLVAEFAKPDR